MSSQRLIPNLERRMATWAAVQERLSQNPTAEPRLTVTISRQFGCEGYPLAERLQQALERQTGTPWAIFDKALLERVSQDTHLSERLLGSVGDQSQFLDPLANLVKGWHTHSEVYAQLAHCLMRIAREGNAIIVGRGGAVVLRQLPNCVHFRLEAPHEHRVRSIQQRLGLEYPDAEAMVVREQQSRDRFIERFLHCSMSDSSHYHAVFNTAKSSIDRIALSIMPLIPAELLAAHRPAA